MLGVLWRPAHVCKACTLPLSHHPFVGFIQGPDHGIIVLLVAKCSLHVHQQVPHRDVFTFVQHAGPFTRVSTKTGKDVGVHTGLIILLQKGIHVERVHHFRPQIGRLEDWHIQSCWCQPFSFPAPPAASAPLLVTRHLTRSGVSIGVWCSPVWGGRGQTPSADYSTLGPWWPSTRVHCPSITCRSRLCPFPNPGDPPILLRCTPHQLAQRV